MLFLCLLLQFNGKDGEECGWNVIKEVAIPPTADFIDYSGMAFRGEKVTPFSLIRIDAYCFYWLCRFLLVLL
jgi:hypothetical protein